MSALLNLTKNPGPAPEAARRGDDGGGCLRNGAAAGGGGDGGRSPEQGSGATRNRNRRRREPAVRTGGGMAAGRRGWESRRRRHRRRRGAPVRAGGGAAVTGGGGRRPERRVPRFRPRERRRDGAAVSVGGDRRRRLFGDADARREQRGRAEQPADPFHSSSPRVFRGLPCPVHRLPGMYRGGMPGGGPAAKVAGGRPVPRPRRGPAPVRRGAGPGLAVGRGGSPERVAAAAPRGAALAADRLGPERSRRSPSALRRRAAEGTPARPPSTSSPSIPTSFTVNPGKASPAFSFPTIRLVPALSRHDALRLLPESEDPEQREPGQLRLVIPRGDR